MSWLQQLTLDRFSALDLAIIVAALLLGFFMARISRNKELDPEASVKHVKKISNEDGRETRDHLVDAFDLSTRPEAIPTLKEQ